MDDLRYPIGKIALDGNITASERVALIDSLARLPAALAEALKGLAEDQLDTPYRPGGWTLRQVVHHLADSHLNAYVRIRLALTEETPQIKPYDENAWSRLPDAISAPASVSQMLLEALHNRWVSLMRSLPASDFARQFRHPERGLMSLDTTLRLYEWHGRHHLAHITALRSRNGWQ